jgi:rfaE bifunctional protein kinase chain/domain
MNSLNKDRTLEILNRAKGKKIAVIGDVMIDRYFWGSVSRVSPEAPVPVVDIDKESSHLGGAANVAANLNSLGIKPYLCGLIGDDANGERFISIAEELNMDTSALYKDPNRPTTIKTRIIGNNQQIARLDREIRDDIDDKGAEFIFAEIQNIKDLAGIIFEDYNKGVITQRMIKKISRYANENDIPIYVDPKFDNFFEYQNVTLFKPNKKEASKALGFEFKNKDDIQKAGAVLLEKLNAKNILLTLGADGMMLFEKNGSVFQTPTKAKHVSDVSGAGDTAIATFAACISGGALMSEAAALANYASGVVCESPGIVSIQIEELLKSVQEK